MKMRRSPAKFVSVTIVLVKVDECSISLGKIEKLNTSLFPNLLVMNE